MAALLAAPAAASTTANEIVYTTDPGAQDSFYDVVLADPEARTSGRAQGRPDRRRHV